MDFDSWNATLSNIVSQVNAANNAAYSKAADLTNGNNLADATADREASDYEASASTVLADRTNSLAQRLASARRTPGGGIRRGMGRKGMSASMLGTGLIKANSAQRLVKRKAELRAMAQKNNDDKYGSYASLAYNGPTSVLGPVVGTRYY